MIFILIKSIGVFTGQLHPSVFYRGRTDGEAVGSGLFYPDILPIQGVQVRAGTCLICTGEKVLSSALHIDLFNAQFFLNSLSHTKFVEPVSHVRSVINNFI